MKTSIIVLVTLALFALANCEEQVPDEQELLLRQLFPKEKFGDIEAIEGLNFADKLTVMRERRPKLPINLPTYESDSTSYRKSATSL